MPCVNVGACRVGDVLLPSDWKLSESSTFYLFHQSREVLRLGTRTTPETDNSSLTAAIKDQAWHRLFENFLSRDNGDCT